MIVTSCPACAASVQGGELFCEACGHALVSPPAESSALPSTDVVTTPPGAPVGRTCANCGAPAEEITPDEYCGRCGMRQPRPGDHRESDLGEVAAAVTDRGLRHHQNEDAYEIAFTADRIVAVVCDGVSSSTTPELAAAAAAAATLVVLAAALEGPGPNPETARRLLADGIARAQLAVARLAEGAGPQTPATTVVAAIVTPSLVAVANVGDSRAYWLVQGTAESSRPLTVDDSCAQDAIAAGVEPVHAYSAADAHTLTHWLGADAGEVAPTISAVENPRDGTVLLCSDGLWNHFPETDQLLGLLAADADQRPIAAAGRMVTAALSAGGEDNITVIVIPAPSRTNPSPNLRSS